MSTGDATNTNTSWTMNNSKRQGIKLTKKYIKMILRSFNSECDVQIQKVTYRNIKTTSERIESIFTQLNKLYSMTGVEIHRDYLNLKVSEMYLAFEYATKKQEEKEVLREERVIERERKKEERKLQEEIRNEKAKINHEIKHHKSILKRLNSKRKLTESEKDNERITNQINEVEKKIEDFKLANENLDFRANNLSAGYVYIISNIGAFGKDIIKIGVTRRLEPLERIKELSSASVPFTYDVHALVFSDSAFKLENELHKYFNEYRVNKVNPRKEFFKVTIDEIEKKLRDYGDLTIDFNREVEAYEYFQSKESIMVK